MSSQNDISQDRPLLWLMAIACGLCAGANYYSQPLINSMHSYFQMPESRVALTVTFAQVAYALGLLFIVPLGDIVNKTKFIPLLMACAGIGLLICALSVNLPMLWLGTAMTGLFSVAAQVLIPFATMSVRPQKIGEVVGLLMSGLLVGILLSTSLSGLLSNLFEWQVIYFVSAILMFILALILRYRLPHIATVKLRYHHILISMVRLLQQEPRLVFRSLVGGCAFAAMSILFSTIAILLQSAFALPNFMVGVVTLIGIFGALSTKFVGKIADRGYTQRMTWVGVITLALSWLLLYWGQYQLISYILGFGMINLGLAIVHTCNQNIIFRLRVDAKSRINSIYMTAYFSGGATGSALGIYAWNHGGWGMSCLVGLALVAGTAIFALIDWRYSRLPPLAS
ncbi:MULTISPECIES: MFS transporter [unclassified Acinetobacter]|uniref:MFS transporter n=1 Tax=unclassified Acinetobacter TaxID=196816 RepID=UPI00293459CE|nr:MULTISPECIES: MFS transporter [unclassified Acinetobacter]WOE31234.1 MFS transporter [Acinetobacter sp. SAAs470]WOE39430.1 MFS transporter [Acinetobacter sp. SAAs474]